MMTRKERKMTTIVLSFIAILIASAFESCEAIPLGKNFECLVQEDVLVTDNTLGSKYLVVVNRCSDTAANRKAIIMTTKGSNKTAEMVQMQLDIVQVKEDPGCYPEIMWLSKGRFCIPSNSTENGLVVGKCFSELSEAMTFEICKRICNGAVLEAYEEWINCLYSGREAMQSDQGYQYVQVSGNEIPGIAEEDLGPIMKLLDGELNETEILTEKLKEEMNNIYSEGVLAKSNLASINNEMANLKQNLRMLKSEVDRIKLPQHDTGKTNELLTELRYDIASFKKDIESRTKGLELAKDSWDCEGPKRFLMECSCGDITSLEYGVLASSGHSAVAIVKCMKGGRQFRSLDIRDINNIRNDEKWYTATGGIDRRELLNLKTRFEKWASHGMPRSYPCESICTLEITDKHTEFFISYRDERNITRRLYYDKTCNCVPMVDSCSTSVNFQGHEMIMTMRSENAQYRYNLWRGDKVLKNFDGYVDGSERIVEELSGPGKYRIEGRCNGDTLDMMFQVSNKEYCNSKWSAEFMLPMRLYCKNSQIINSLLLETASVLILFLVKRFTIAVISGIVSPILVLFYFAFRRCFICKECGHFCISKKRHVHSHSCSKCGKSLVNEETIKVFEADNADLVIAHKKHRKYGCIGKENNMLTEALIASFRTLQSLLKLGFNPLMIGLLMAALLENLPYVDASRLNSLADFSVSRQSFSESCGSHDQGVPDCSGSIKMRKFEVWVTMLIVYSVIKLVDFIISTFECCMCGKDFCSKSDIGIGSVRLCVRCRVVFLDEGICLFLMDEAFRESLGSQPVHTPLNSSVEGYQDEEGYEIPREKIDLVGGRTKESVRWGTVLLRNRRMKKPMIKFSTSFVAIALVGLATIQIAESAISPNYIEQKEILRTSLLNSGFKLSNLVNMKDSERMDLMSSSVKTVCNSGRCEMSGFVDVILPGIEGTSIGYMVRPDNFEDQFPVDVKIMSAYREVVYSKVYDTFPVVHHSKTAFSCTGSMNDCLSYLETNPKDIKFNVTLSHDSSWLCGGWCPLIGTGATCASCWCARAPSGPHMSVLKEVSSTDKIIICIGIAGKGYCSEIDTTTKSGSVTVQKTGESNYIRQGLIAFDPRTNTLHKGPINDKGENSDKFGAVQEYEGKIFYKDDSRHEKVCHFGREPRIEYTKCCKDTWHMLENLTPLHSVRTSKDFTFRVYDGREHGFWNLKIALPSITFTQLVKTLNPSAISGLTCSGCYDCMEGADCILELASATSGLMHLKANTCSLASNKLLTEVGKHSYKFKLFCSSGDAGLELTVGSDSPMTAKTALHLSKGGKPPSSAAFDVLTTEQLNAEGCRTMFCSFDMFNGVSLLGVMSVIGGLILVPIVVFLFFSVMNCICMVTGKSHKS